MIGMLPREFSDSECIRWASAVWDVDDDEPFCDIDVEMARGELTRLARAGGHVTWDDDG